MVSVYTVMTGARTAATPCGALLPYTIATLLQRSPSTSQHQLGILAQTDKRNENDIRGKK